MSIQIGVDASDHFTFFCPSCEDVQLRVQKVKTDVVNKGTKREDKCTTIYLYCPACDLAGLWRKTYWENPGAVDSFKNRTQR